MNIFYTISKEGQDKIPLLSDKELGEIPIAIMNEKGEITKTDYQLSNIHEFLKASYPSNMD